MGNVIMLEENYKHNRNFHDSSYFLTNVRLFIPFERVRIYYLKGHECIELKISSNSYGELADDM